MVRVGPAFNIWCNKAFTSLHSCAQTSEHILQNEVIRETEPRSFEYNRTYWVDGFNVASLRNFDLQVYAYDNAVQSFAHPFRHMLNLV